MNCGNRYLSVEEATQPRQPEEILKYSSTNALSWWRLPWYAYFRRSVRSQSAQSHPDCILLESYETDTNKCRVTILGITID